MPLIKLELLIDADRSIVFDLARSIDLHMVSAGKTNEKAIAGRTSGLIEVGESVTWRAKHLGFYQKLSVIITEMERPDFFADEMTKGAFKRFHHVHRFVEEDGKTRMIDEFDYESPLGFLGKITDWLFLESYMKRFLEERNLVIKEFAESGKWKEVLTERETVRGSGEIGS